MLKIILQAVDPLLMSDAESYFHESYIEGLRSKSTYRASIVARYFISRLVYDLFNVKDFLPCVDSAGKPIFDSLIYWSIAHTGDTVFVGVSDGAIGVDIEEIKTRDTSVWWMFTEAEWNILGAKNWENFYSLWTTKESLIKFHRGILEDMHKYRFNWREIIESNKCSWFSFFSPHPQPLSFQRRGENQGIWIDSELCQSGDSVLFSQKLHFSWLSHLSSYSGRLNSLFYAVSLTSPTYECEKN